MLIKPELVSLQDTNKKAWPVKAMLDNPILFRVFRLLNFYFIYARSSQTASCKHAPPQVPAAGAARSTAGWTG